MPSGIDGRCDGPGVFLITDTIFAWISGRRSVYRSTALSRAVSVCIGLYRTNVLPLNCIGLYWTLSDNCVTNAMYRTVSENCVTNSLHRTVLDNCLQQHCNGLYQTTVYRSTVTDCIGHLSTAPLSRTVSDNCLPLHRLKLYRTTVLPRTALYRTVSDNCLQQHCNRLSAD